MVARRDYWSPFGPILGSIARELGAGLLQKRFQMFQKLSKFRPAALLTSRRFKPDRSGGTPRRFGLLQTPGRIPRVPDRAQILVRMVATIWQYPGPDMDLELELELSGTATQCVASTRGWYPCTHGIPLHYIYVHTGQGQAGCLGCAGIERPRGIPFLVHFWSLLWHPVSTMMPKISTSNIPHAKIFMWRARIPELPVFPPNPYRKKKPVVQAFFGPM